MQWGALDKPVVGTAEEMEIAKRMLFPSTCQLKNKTRLFGQCKLTWPLAFHHQRCSQCYSFYSQAPTNCCSSALNADACFICPGAEQPSLPSSVVLGGLQQGGPSHLQGFTSHIRFSRARKATCLLSSVLPFPHSSRAQPCSVMVHRQNWGPAAWPHTCMREGCGAAPCCGGAGSLLAIFSPGYPADLLCPSQ